MKDENKTSTGDVIENDLNYSFDFANQINNDGSNETENNGEVSNPKLVDVSVPVMESAETDSAYSAPITEQTEKVTDSSSASVSEPSLESEQVTNNSEKIQTDVQDSDDGKSTFRFVMIIIVIIAAFIAALPFIIKYLG